MSGRPPLKKQVIRQTLRDVGPECTLENVQNALRAAGLGTCHEHTFYVHRRQVFPQFRRKKEGPVVKPHEANGHVKVPDVIPGFDDPPAPGDGLDYLEKLIRFGAAVEAVGGIEVAQKLLDGLRQLRGAFR